MSTLTQAAFARHLNVRPSYVKKLKDTGRLVMVSDTLIDVEASEARIRETADPGKVAVAERHAAKRAGQAAAAMETKAGPRVDGQKMEKTASQEMAEKTSSTYQQSRAVKERYNALQAKADYEAFIGKLVDAGVARSAGAELGAMFRAALEYWPDTIGPTLVGRDENSIRSILMEHVENLLHSIEHQIKTRILERKNEN